MPDLKFFCSCGATAKASGYPPAAAEGMMAELRRLHVEVDGHHEVDAVESKRIRAKIARDERKVLRG